MITRYKYSTGLKAACAAVALCLNIAASPVQAQVNVSPNKVGTEQEAQDIHRFCGTKKVRVALSDGFGGNAWRKVARRELEDEAAKCPNITSVAYVDAQGKPEKQISDVKSLIAQKFDIIIVFPDAGEALLPAIREGMRAGLVVVPHSTGAEFPGKPGSDYTALATPDQQHRGKVWAKWIAEKLHGQGNVVLFGGSPGSTITATQMVGVREVLAKYPGIKVLEGPISTNWDPAQFQRAATGLLAKYPKIDALYSDYATGVMGALRAFQTAGRPLPLVTGVEANELSCFWEDKHGQQPSFQFASVNSGTSATRLALRKGMAAAQGIANTEPSIIQEAIFIDSSSSDPALAVRCDRTLPPDAAPRSTKLSAAQMKALFAK
jgi:ribose transport system substrate-binding protein